MIERIKRLTNLQEAILVIIIGLGLFIYSSLRGFFVISTGSSKTWTYFLSEHGSLRIVVIEIISLGIISFILNKRGWKLEHLNLKVSFSVFLRSILLLLLTFFITGLVYRLIIYLGTVDNEAVESIKFVRHKNYLIWGLILIVNSIFEEFIYVGYLFKRLENSNRGLFIVLSSTLRTIIHLYQGFYAIIPHFVVGLIFGSYYTKYRQLTTLIVTHGLLNLIILWRAS